MDSTDRATLETLPPASEGAGGSQPVPQELDEYRIIELIGRGSSGYVYRAIDQTLERVVALKLIRHRDGAKGERLYARLLSEARAAARLQHPGIAAIYRAGVADGVPYLVEEFVEGRSLAAFPKPQPWREVLALGLDLASALMAAHQRGVLHRDIKPANIMIAKTGTAKLVDFGLAKLIAGLYSDESAFEQSVAPNSTLASNLASESGIVGTPYYMAPEVWRRQPATPRSDVYALGVVLYEQCCGHVPFHEVPTSRLSRATADHDAMPLASIVPDIDQRFAAIIERCLARDPDERFADGGALWDALASRQGNQVAPLPHGNPYRGLMPFEAEHAGLFFGRDEDVRRIAERLRSERIVIVAGESGIGKSSTVRAGLLPYIARHGLNDGRSWSAYPFVPGMHPLTRLGDVLARILGSPEAELVEQLAVDAGSVSRRLHRHQSTTAAGAILFVDQLEELVTASGRDEAVAVSEVLVCLAERTPGVRLVATIRGDKLTAVAELAGIGERLERTLVLLRPLARDAIRKTVVGPAVAKGVRFESEATIDTLVQSAASAPGGLPLLQFAMTLLWQHRDTHRGVIPDGALDDIGGVAGALSQYADEVIDALLPETRSVARHLLLQLVSIDGTRRLRAETELAGSDTQRRTALDALVKGRLVVARESDGTPVYELAHEALATGWSRLRRWLDEEGGERAVKEHLLDAASEWQRRGRSSDTLWRGSQLRDARLVAPGDVAEPARAFLQQSRRAERRRRRQQLALALLAFVLAAGVYPVLQYWHARQVAHQVDQYLRRAGEAFPAVADAFDHYFVTRQRALALFQKDEKDNGERVWAEALELAPMAEDTLYQARQPLELAFRQDSSRRAVREMLATILHMQACLAHAQGNESERARLLANLAQYDHAQTWLRQWTQPVSVTFDTSKPGMLVAVARYERHKNRRLVLRNLQQRLPAPATWQLEPGSYLFTTTAASASNEVTVRYPLLIKPLAMGGRSEIRVSLDIPEHVPEGYVYVASGTFLYGYGANRYVEPVRQWYQTIPEHERQTNAFIIAKVETTYGDWIAYRQQQRVRPDGTLDIDNSDNTTGALVTLQRLGSEFLWTFRATTTSRTYVGASRSLPNITYKARTRRATQEWLRFPVTGMTVDVAVAYTQWLGTFGGVPGARLCREDEWERATRGADGRLYAHGDWLTPDDANFDLTYGRGAYGLDVVDAYPDTESPFSLLGTAGNARELVTEITGNGHTLRAGSYFFSAPTGAAPNREVVDPQQGLPYVGFRVCADWPAPRER